jgi:hypothetical protein
MVVEKGNKILIPADKLTATEVKVEWSKNFTSHSEQYYSVPFYNKDQGQCKQGLPFQTGLLTLVYQGTKRA